MSRTRTQLLAWIGNRIGKPPGWERLVRRLMPMERCAALGEICMMRDGVAFLARPSVPIGWHVALFGSYEPELREVFRAILRPGGVAVDIGANIGWHTLLMARLVKAHGKVFAVEANPSVRLQLQTNIELNRFRQVEVVPCALADRPGTLAFLAPNVDHPDAGNGHVVRDVVASPQTIAVEARRLDDVLDDAQPDRLDLIKIDVEGFEWPVLCGAQKTVTRFRPHILFEFDASYAPRGGGTASLIDAFFRGHRYRLYVPGRNWAECVSADNWPDCANIWAVPEGGE